MQATPEQIELGIQALENIGEASHSDLNPDPLKMSRAEGEKIIRDHVLSIAKLEGWVVYLQEVGYEQDSQSLKLWNLLERRISEAAQIIAALSVVN